MGPGQACQHMTIEPQFTADVQQHLRPLPMYIEAVVNEYLGRSSSCSFRVECDRRRADLGWLAKQAARRFLGELGQRAGVENKGLVRRAMQSRRKK